jgi:hypothetical protein
MEGKTVVYIPEDAFLNPARDDCRGNNFLVSGFDFRDNNNYYLFKKILVSDWLTANCEIVISTQWLTKYGFFTFILAK